MHKVNIIMSMIFISRKRSMSSVGSLFPALTIEGFFTKFRWTMDYGCNSFICINRQKIYLVKQLLSASYNAALANQIALVVF